MREPVDQGIDRRHIGRPLDRRLVVLDQPGERFGRVVMLELVARLERLETADAVALQQGDRRLHLLSHRYASPLNTCSGIFG